jgi:3-oxoacyl-[acyl-carrier-protein] synthase II
MTAVTITGMGLVTPVGRKLDDVFDALCAGRSGLRTPPDGHPVSGWVDTVGIAPDIEPIEVLPATDIRCVDRFVLLAMAAADDAISDARIEIGRDVDPERVAVVVSTGAGGFKTYEDFARQRWDRGRPAISPYLLPGMLSNMAAARIAIKYGIRGYSSAPVTACAAGAQAVAEGLRLIRSGDADVVICGAGEASLHPTITAAFTNARALAHGWTDPTAASRPFDKKRNGFVLGEGGGIFVLERTDFAEARGATGYADLLGWGGTTDAYHPTKPRPDGSGAAGSMRKALANAGRAPSDVDYVNAHGTSTTLGDVAETVAIHSVFGADGPAVSSIKALTGHLLGASGVVEAAVCTLAVSRGILPPTANLDDPDPACDLDHIRGTPRVGPVGLVLSNTFAFGGHNVTLAFGRPSTTSTRTTMPAHMVDDTSSIPRG